MTRKKCVLGMIVLATIAVLAVKTTIGADEPAGPSPTMLEQWDDVAPVFGEQRPDSPPDQFDDRPPPGPPRDADRNGPMPPRRDRGPGADRQQPPGPPRAGEWDRPVPPHREGGPDADRGRNMPPRDADRNGPMPPRRDRGPDADRQQPPGLGRFPHESLEFLEKADPEMFKLLKEDRDLGRQSHELAMQYRRAPSDQREKLKQQIADLVGKHFDVRQQRRALELKRLESELQRLRDLADRRANAKKELVEKRVSELVGREDEVRF